MATNNNKTPKQEDITIGSLSKDIFSGDTSTENITKEAAAIDNVSKKEGPFTRDLGVGDFRSQRATDLLNAGVSEEQRRKKEVQKKANKDVREDKANTTEEVIDKTKLKEKPTTITINSKLPEGPAPVTRDLEGKLSTNFSPLEEGPTVQEKFATDSGIKFKRGGRNQVMFQPDNLNQAINLFNAFGPDVSIDPASTTAIRGSKVYQSYLKYKGADTQTLFTGMKNNEIGVGGETWDNLTRMNGGVETPEMIEAKQKWELETNISNINDTGDAANGKSAEKAEVKVNTDLKKLDSDFISIANKLFAGAGDAWKVFKTGNQTTRELNTDIISRTAKINDIRFQKRKLLRKVQKENPQMPLSTVMVVANKEMEILNDNLFILQRDQNIDISTLKAETTALQGEFEFKAKQANTKLDLMSQIYETQRGDIINAKAIERADTLLADQIARAEEAKKQAIIDGDKEAARKFAYDLALAQEKAKLNKTNKSKFQGFSTSGGLMVFDPNTGDVEFKESGVAEDGVTPVITTGNITQNYGATSPVSKDNVTLANGKVGTPGVDIDGKLGDPITAFTGGIVDSVQSVQGFGNRVVIKDENGNLHAYNHLQDSNVNIGDTIIKGQNIATMGNTGTVIKGEGGDGSHLDYRVSNNGDISLSGGNWIDPNQFISETPTGLAKEALVFNIGQSIFGNKISDRKGAKVQRFVDLGVSEGKNIDQIIDKILLFKPTANKDLGQIFKDVLVANNINLDDFDMRRLGNLLSDNKLSKAITKIEKGVLNNSRTSDPEGFVSERLTKTMVRRADELTGLIEELNNTKEGKKNPIGTTTGTIEDWLGRFKSAEAVELKNKATRLVSDFRLKNLGSAVTETESKFLDGVIPELFDSTANFVVKVDQFKDQAFGEINDFRGILELPPLDDTTLFNKVLRAESYRQSTTPLQPTGGTSLREQGRNRTTTPITPSSGINFSGIKK